MKKVKFKVTIQAGYDKKGQPKRRFEEQKGYLFEYCGLQLVVHKTKGVFCFCWRTSEYLTGGCINSHYHTRKEAVANVKAILDNKQYRKIILGNRQDYLDKYGTVNGGTENVETT